MLSRSQAFAAAFSAKKALLNVNATVNAERTFTFTSAMLSSGGAWTDGSEKAERQSAPERPWQELDLRNNYQKIAQNREGATAGNKFS